MHPDVYASLLSPELGCDISKGRPPRPGSRHHYHIFLPAWLPKSSRSIVTMRHCAFLIVVACQTMSVDYDLSYSRLYLSCFSTNCPQTVFSLVGFLLILRRFAGLVDWDEEVVLESLIVLGLPLSGEVPVMVGFVPRSPWQQPWTDFPPLSTLSLF